VISNLPGLINVLSTLVLIAKHSINHWTSQRVDLKLISGNKTNQAQMYAFIYDSNFQFDLV